MWVWSRSLKPVECNWCSRVLASVGESIPERFDTDRAHYIVYWKSIEARRAPFERAYAAKIARVLSETRILAQSTYRNTQSSTSVEHAIRQSLPKKLRTVLHQLYADVGSHFGSQNSILSSIKATAGEYDPFSDPKMRAWFDAVVGPRITNATNFTAEDINRIIRDAIEKGRSLQDTVASLADSYGLSDTRATTIARTETVSAGNAGTYFSVIANMGTGLIKIWLATQDDRTRDSHINANGQKKQIEEPFKVDGSELLFPGDASLGAHGKELVNCRCTLTFERDRSARNTPAVVTGAQLRARLLGDYGSRRDTLNNVNVEIGDNLEKFNRFIKDGVSANDEEVVALRNLLAQLRDQASALKKQLDLSGELLQPTSAGLKQYVTGGPGPLTRKRIDEAFEFVSRMIGSQSDLKGFTIQVDVSSTPIRAHAINASVFIDSRTPTQVIVHEIGHVVEQGDALVRAQIRALYKERTVGERAISLNKATGRSGYAADEITKVDKWIDPYMGKLYDHGMTELLSMGLEYMYNDPVKLMRKDPELFDIIINALRRLAK
jgi:hypothetical protein